MRLNKLCEWKEYPEGRPSTKHLIMCGENAKLYRKKNGEAFCVIKNGHTILDNKQNIKLCPKHFEELSATCKDLEEAQ
jgi:hypothetical protein